MQIGQQCLDDTRAEIALGHELANARNAHGDEGKLRGRKEAVESNERQDTDQTHSKHGVADVPLDKL